MQRLFRLCVTILASTLGLGPDEFTKESLFIDVAGSITALRWPWRWRGYEVLAMQ
jgi:hypothetical protein